MATIEELKEILTVLFDGELDLSNITESTSLTEDLGMNSIAMLYTALTLEERYGVSFKNEDFESLKTIEDVISKIESKG